ncbi:hypothetical protein OA2633_00120 [Oceanicaulis sp. HTCC2633]|uniref:helix-turn-helix domain-containing protein n=1 Tax=Oceanicaulis sp. HTCC2633 TaxID=314254 RepID=UPI0000669A71|nr:helix-turn-helix domain-containing protein [Oceanicaulis sp. HTCC2633]EAP89151.1 hypothetical protein OA2633_00120 [Oceanicaulis sp. HTCC2633]
MSDAALAHAPRGFVQRSEYDRLQRALDEALEKLAYFEAEAAAAHNHARRGPDEWALTATEAYLCRMLAAHERLTRRKAYSLWPGDETPSSKALDVHLTSIRRKLACFGLSIHNQHGRGWYFAPEERRFVLAALDGGPARYADPADGADAPAQRVRASVLYRRLLEALEDGPLQSEDLRRLANWSRLYGMVRSDLIAQGLVEMTRRDRAQIHTITEAGRTRLDALRKQDAPAAETEGRDGPL